MFPKPQFRTSRIFATTVLLSFALTPGTAISQDILSSEEVLAEQSPSDPIEEVIVYGDKTLYHYRLEMYRAQDLVFTAFNEINSDDQFDVHCNYEASPGTRIRRHVCKANFVREAEENEALGFMLRQPHNPSRTAIMQKHNELMEEMDRLVAENPRLREAVVKYGHAIQSLEIARHEKCDGRIIACRK